MQSLHSFILNSMMVLKETLENLDVIEKRHKKMKQESFTKKLLFLWKRYCRIHLLNDKFDLVI